MKTIPSRKAENNGRVLLSDTKSVCPVCLKRIEARYTAGADGVFLEKVCLDHGDFCVPVWDNPLDFLRWKTRVIDEPDFKSNCPYDCGICANHLQATCCVLLEVTQRCNLGCPICFASSGGEHTVDDPGLTTIAGWYDMLMANGGPFNIQLSGGEPTMRDDLPEIICLGKEKGFSFFQLNTNGLRIANETGYIEKLKEAGLSTVFLQFDGFSDKANLALRGRSITEDKIRAVQRCKEAHIGVVLVPTVMKGANDDELGDILRFAADNMPIVRGVHFQPVSLFGRYSAGEDARITFPELFNKIERQTDGKLKRTDFLPSNAEHPLCGFHATYTVKDGNWTLLSSGEDCSCGISSDQARRAVANKWTAPAEIVPSEKTSSIDVSFLDKFLMERQNTTLAISGMAFQDAYTMDLNRLRRCYIHIVSPEGKLIPFCSYNLSSDTGKTLYR
ncbi:MAG TPA: radical SAM protein [Clostridiaceae bacterium]|nr:radical SAM protein [Clostridiaceae bacterium]